MWSLPLIKKLLTLLLFIVFSLQAQSVITLGLEGTTGGGGGGDPTFTEEFGPDADASLAATLSSNANPIVALVGSTWYNGATITLNDVDFNSISGTELVNHTRGSGITGAAQIECINDPTESTADSFDQTFSAAPTGSNTAAVIVENVDDCTSVTDTTTSDTTSCAVSSASDDFCFGVLWTWEGGNTDTGGGAVTCNQTEGPIIADENTMPDLFSCYATGDGGTITFTWSNTEGDVTGVCACIN